MSPDRRSRWSGSPQGDLFSAPAVTAGTGTNLRQSRPSPRVEVSSAEVERARVGTLLMLFQLSDAPGDTGRVASLYFADALASWHASRSSLPPVGGFDDPPF
jgi:hypothetical protein